MKRKRSEAVIANDTTTTASSTTSTSSSAQSSRTSTVTTVHQPDGKTIGVEPEKKRSRTNADGKGSALCREVLLQLERIGCSLQPNNDTESTPPAPLPDATKSDDNTTTTTTSSAVRTSVLRTSIDRTPLKLPPALHQWMHNVTWPKDLVLTNSERGLVNIVLHPGWELRGPGHSRAAIEVGSAQNDAHVAYYMVLPHDSADPANPDLVIKCVDTTDGPFTKTDTGVPLAQFLSELTLSHVVGSFAHDKKHSGADNAQYAGFLQALAVDKELPSEDEEDDEHDASADDSEDDDDFNVQVSDAEAENEAEQDETFDAIDTSAIRTGKRVPSTTTTHTSTRSTHTPQPTTTTTPATTTTTTRTRAKQPLPQLSLGQALGFAADDSEDDDEYKSDDERDEDDEDDDDDEDDEDYQ
eukprot:TRINITY_DN4862_c0_g1_i1.p1 TRINITY_DN4862_c0_g1~~TRINITY_DN4862_c0_g1_i1.p1  ORF type:complete len:420 (-),score=118.29 TRINITY_DN4862_c0_g1_i1:97-1332(-)